MHEVADPWMGRHFLMNGFSWILYQCLVLNVLQNHCFFLRRYIAPTFLSNLSSGFFFLCSFLIFLNQKLLSWLQIWSPTSPSPSSRQLHPTDGPLASVIASKTCPSVSAPLCFHPALHIWQWAIRSDRDKNILNPSLVREVEYMLIIQTNLGVGMQTDGRSEISGCSEVFRQCWPLSLKMLHVIM